MSEPEHIAEADMTDRQKRFVKEYLLDLNATRAAIRAGYSPNGASQQGSTLLANPKIAEAVAVEQSIRSQRTGVTADKVLRELALIAFADIGDVVKVDEQGKVCVKDLQAIPARARRAIGEITQTSTERKEKGPDGTEFAEIEKVRLSVKHHSKVAALKLLMDHLGLSAPQKIEHSGNVGLDLDRMSAAEIEAEIAALQAQRGVESADEG